MTKGERRQKIETPCGKFVGTAAPSMFYEGHTTISTTTDMRFVQNFTPPDFQAKNFTQSISPNFNSFSDKNTKK